MNIEENKLDKPEKPNKKSVRKERKEDGSYIFPNILASSMRKVNQRVQYEAGLISMSIILVSLVSIGIFTILFTDYSIGMKIMTGINTVALFVFLSSNLVTTYQQYFQYMSFCGILNDENTKDDVIGFKDIKENKLGKLDDLDDIKKESKRLKELEEKELGKPELKELDKKDIDSVAEQIKKDMEEILK